MPWRQKNMGKCEKEETKIKLKIGIKNKNVLF